MNTSVPGVHTCIATSYNNGCSVVKTYTVLQDIVPPALVDRGTFTLDCSPNPTVLIQPQFTGTTTGFTYSWTAPSNVLISNPTASYQIANGVGIYKVVVTNTLNGCVSSAIFDVIPGTLTAQFTPDKDKGFAPLSVQFSNLSTSSNGSSSITCLWNFSNGQTSTQFNSSTTFNSPGIYTVVLIATKGPCQDTSYHVITVESPSSLEVPNIFTPNGDGVNDVFRLIATQLKNIRIIIFDRWGNRVYEVESETGNIAWDGKNLQGKECAAGVYFYVLTAKGQDDTEYEKKGNITLSR
jgi:gliding motility-associated-like protein